MTKTVRTTGIPHKIELVPYKNEIAIGDTAIIKMWVTDKNGVTIPTVE